MNTKLKMFIHRNRILLVTLGLTTILGGVALAYFTGDAEPWGTIGGFFFSDGSIISIDSRILKKGLRLLSRN
jgi:hypothetical protein